MIARLWARGGAAGGDDEFAASLRQMGAPEAVIEEWARPAPIEVPVLPGNERIVEVFFAVATQWRTQPMGGLLGLDYGAVDVCLRRLGLEVTPEEWRGLQVMERAAVGAANG